MTHLQNPTLVILAVLVTWFVMHSARESGSTRAFRALYVTWRGLLLALIAVAVGVGLAVAWTWRVFDSWRRSY